MSSGVEFDVDSAESAVHSPSRPYVGVTKSAFVGGGGYAPGSNEPKMVQWLMKKGIVSSPKGAQMILIGLVIVNLIITYVVISYFLL